MPMPPSPLAGTGEHRPIYLLADSRLLFRSADGQQGLAERLLADLPPGPHSAAYLGASNGDEPAFYEIFEAAMDQLGIHRRRHIKAAATEEDLAFLAGCHLILLAGGDVGTGWRALESNGSARLVAERYRQGAVLVGVSAGAVQLGQGWLEPENDAFLRTLGLLPFLIDAHDEPDWRHLRQSLAHAPDYVGGLGIPLGGGAVVAPDMTVEPLEKPVLELFRREDFIQEALLLPPTPETPAGALPN